MKSEQVVQQNKISGKVRRQAEVTFTYTPNGPTLEALLKSAAHRGSAGAGSVTAWRYVKKARQPVGRLPSTCA